MRTHFIAIGGAAMHNLALALHNKGYHVTGSDDAIFEPSKSRLEKKGLLPKEEGWFPEKITTDIEAIILGMHAKADNPELLKAQELGLKIYSYPEFLYEQSKNKTRVVIGGSHGKTTITSMILHVMHYHNIEVDYMVGAQLEGFDTMVHLTEDNDFIVLEGDEYLTSPIDLRPKFHLYQPNIALLSGIAWDHINVFPTFEFYLEQFVIFMNKIESGGVLIYNETDEVLNKLVLSNKRDNIRYIPYKVPAHQITNGQTYITLDGAEGPLSVFGDHNLLNMQAAYYACAELGITAKDFVQAMANFTGASKRLELLASNAHCNIYRDFAHAPSKVIATIEAVKQQFPSRKLIGVLELHTYSSLNKEFMHQYKGALDKTDTAVVFYSKHALHIKGLPVLRENYVVEGFNKNGLLVMTDKSELEQWLRAQDYTNTNLVLMSSGNYDGIDLPSFTPTLI